MQGNGGQNQTINAKCCEKSRIQTVANSFKYIFSDETTTISVAEVNQFWCGAVTGTPPNTLQD